MIGTAPWLMVVLAASAVAMTPWTRRLVGGSPQPDAGAAWLRQPLPAVAAALAGWAAAAAAQNPFELVGFALLGLGCAMLVLVDLSVKRLPDLLVGPSALGLLVALALAATASGQWGRLGQAILAGFVVCAGYFILALLRPSDLGLGDVKLAAPLGLLLGWFGWDAVLTGTLLSFALAGVLSALLLATRLAGRRSSFPFGPWMVAGTVLGVALSGG